ncbi:MAG TPA: FHA domain-containing protein [Gemmatimonadales bacterium]|nr:FHA domain-containing protein [Gemmatimonadales bacterium]
MSDLILEIVEGSEAGRQLPLDSVIDVGREPSLPLHLDADTQVSRRHARISQQGGQVVVEDLGSTNGTYVNDQPIGSPRAISPGDKVRIGLTVLELRTKQQVAARPSAVQVRPALTAVGNDVLLQVPEAELAPVGNVSPEGPIATAQPAPPPPPPQPQAGGPGFRAQETPPGFVPAEVIGDPQAESDYGAISRWVDVKVKQQQKIAVFAMISAGAIAVIIYFGLT